MSPDFHLNGIENKHRWADIMVQSGSILRSMLTTHFTFGTKQKHPMGG